jgi:hypothetical protein
MKKFLSAYLIPLFVVMLVSGCGIVEGMTETKGKTDKVAIQIEKDLGVKPFIGFNIHNGSLKQLTVNFGKDLDEKISIEEVGNTVSKAIANSLDDKPENTVITFVLK